MACSPTSRPASLASRSPSSKWMPPYRRDSPAWSAASVNDFQDKVTGAAGTVPGSTLELPAGMVIDMPRSSLPVKSWSTAAAAALKVECPEMYSGNGGGGEVGGWEGRQDSPRAGFGR